MKFFKILFILVCIFSLIIIFSCQQGLTNPNETGTSSSSSSSSDFSTPSGLTFYYQTTTVPTISNFPMGYTGIFEPVHTVPTISSFKIGKYEVTYNQWYIVKTWAIANSYYFANAGREGNDGTDDNAPTSAKNEPVTKINWRDCIVWCNAASEYEGFTPVYYSDSIFNSPIKDSRDGSYGASLNTTAGSFDNPYVNWSANGYRLITQAEWEACARYIDGSSWLRGDVPSGWIDNNPADGNWRIETGGNWTDDGGGDNYNEVHAVAWWDSNSSSATHDIGLKNANMLNLYDMAGNVWEWCWDWYGTYTTSSPYTDANSRGPTSGSWRIYRGGGWDTTANGLICSGLGLSAPYNESNNVGFRLARGL